MRTVQRCKEVIHRVAGRLIQEKKEKISEGEKSGDPYDGKDLLTLLCVFGFCFLIFIYLTSCDSEVQRSGRPTARTTDI